ncbi:MAG TPA: histidine phosphatase family protein [Gaiellaceae bacterium]|nr:histidine phosphatase family protein [Gaiellaceae bacterium]
MELLLLARHGQSELNVKGVVNGDPTRDPGLTDVGREQAESLGRQIAGVTIDLCVASLFLRAQQTAHIASGRVPELVDGGLNDIQVGELEGRTLADYRAWKHAHTRDDAFPGGESLNDAARRYADAFERLLACDEHTIFVVCHEIPVRYAVNAAAGSTDLDGPLHDVANASPYVFDAAGLRRAVDGMRAAAESLERA